MIRKLHILFLLLISQNLLAQQYVDILKLNGGITSPNKFDSSSNSTQIKDIGADLTVPIKRDPLTTIISGLTFESINTKLFPSENAKTFSSVTLKIGLNKKLTEKLSGTLVALPKIASNFGKLNSNDFQFGSLLLFKYEKSKSFNYKLHKAVQVGFNFNGQIRSYHVSSISSNINSAYISRSTNEFFGYLRFNFGKNIFCQLKAGQSLGRYYRVYNDNDKVTFGLPALFIGDKRKQLNTDFSDGMLFQVGLVYRVGIGEDKK